MQRNTTHLARLMRRGSVRWWLVALVLYLLVVPTQFVAPPTARFITDIAWTAAALLAAVSSYRTARILAGAERIAWLLFAIANAAWAAGQIAWDVYELILGITVPFPS